MRLRKWTTGLAVGLFGWLLLASNQPVSAAQEHIDFEV
ncbi:putative cell surface protein precursor [Latilactobacillus sakei subsp. sakei LS25]|nr:putative cell surface protein precursor [Latilactobacillus sakei subsp. sakei LS25]